MTPSRARWIPSVFGVCLGSAAYAALTAALAEGAYLALRTPLGADSYHLLLATLLCAAALVPPALLLGLVQAVAIAAYPEGTGVRRGLAGLGGWFVGGAYDRRHPARSLARPVATTCTVVVLAYLGARIGAETVRSWLPESMGIEVSPVMALAAVMGTAAVLLYLGFHVFAVRFLGLLSRLGSGRLPSRRVVLTAAFVLAGVAAATVVAGGESVEAMGGRERGLYLTFIGAQIAFAVALATPGYAGWGRWLAARLWVVGLVALLPAGNTLVYGLERVGDVRKALHEDTHVVKRAIAVYQLMSDEDGDGYSALLGGGDCDDHRADIRPNGEEIPGDGIDQDCDGIDPQPVELAPAEPDPAIAAEEAEEERAPYNIVVITVDTLRWDRLSSHGYHRKTSPNIDEFAAGGARFTKAWAQGPNTKASTTSFFAGQYFSEVRKCDHLWVHVHPDQWMFPEAAMAGGFATGAVPTHRFFTGLDGHMDGFEHLDNSLVKKYGRGVNWRPMAHLTTARALKMLDTLEGEVAAGDKKGFLLWVHYYDPHSAFLRHPGQPNWGNSPSDLYDGEILFLDKHLKPLLDRLDARKDDTAVFFHSDHGDGLGDHGYLYHGRSLHDDNTRIPLLARMPGAAPQVIDTPVSNVDLAPTVLDLMRLPIPDELSGRSLVPMITGKQATDLQRPVYSEIVRDKKRKPQRSWLRWPWKLILNVDKNSRKLFNLESDPNEQTNVAAEHPEVKARLAMELDAFMKQRVKYKAPENWDGHAEIRVLRN